MRRIRASATAFIGAVMLLSGSPAQPEETAPGAAQQAKQRLELMQRTVHSFSMRSATLEPQRFIDKPLLRYSDPTRGISGETTLLDAGLWRLGKTGRPTAIVTLEIYRAPDKPDTLSYEFLSLTDEKFSLGLDNDRRIGWEATGTDLKLKALTNAPQPATTEADRLRQMRELARRFRAIETLQDEKIECRLMSQPIDRYADREHGILDGAVFVFANATNPEGGLLLECDEKTWRFGAFRLSSAPLSFELDEVVAASFPFFGEYGRKDGPYTSASRPLGESDK